ncbi:MAG: O-succinylhomoserine sulfhydrylase [Hyphomonadaceae bacterium]
MAEKKTSADLRPATKLVRGGLTRSQHKETSEAIFMTSGFVYDSAAEADARFAGASPGYLYGRYANPTVRMFEERLMALEGAEECIAVGSGMAAVNAAVLANVKAGDRVIGARAMFASCLWILDTLLPRLGVEVIWVDGEDLDQWRAAAKKPVRLALIETPSNPVLGAVDIAAVAEIVHAAGGWLIADNVFASPVLQNPLKFGADLVTYSTTKHIDGQGRTLGGAILGDKAKIDEAIRDFLRHTGPAISPFNAWVLVKGMETIQLRVDQMCRNAAHVADAFAKHPKIERLYYPGRADHPQRAIHAKQMRAGGSLVCFDVAGGREGAWKFLDSLQLIDISNNLGDAKSLATHPQTTTHRRISEEARAHIGVKPGTVRLSVGLEDAEDLADDIREALAQV